MPPEWKKYEDVARQLLMHLRKELDLVQVEGKQKLVGRKSGTEWEIEAKGVRSSDGAYVLVECRRYTTSRLNQEDLGGLAWRIIDTEASGGIAVSPLPLQVGAEKVAKAANIVHVQIDADSTPDNFGMRFMSQLLFGVTATASATATADMTVERTCGCGAKFDPDANAACPQCGNATRAM